MDIERIIGVIIVAVIVWYFIKDDKSDNDDDKHDNIPWDPNGPQFY